METIQEKKCHYNVVLFNASLMHRKNREAISQYDQITFNTIDDITKISPTIKYDAIYSPCHPINIKSLPPNLQSNTKYIFGPHFSVFPNKEQLTHIIHPNTTYIQPSNWVCELWQSNPEFQSITPKINIQPIPFCVNTTRFQPSRTISDRTDIFIYYKRREPNELNYILNHFKQINQPVHLFNYDKHYNESHYLNTLQNAKYGIWLDAHESQGFALEEALSCDVPLLVWNVKTLNQEYGSSYPPFPATTIPYWNNQCGETFYDRDEFIDKLKQLNENLTNYKPREYILNNLSKDVCQSRFVALLAQ